MTLYTRPKNEVFASDSPPSEIKPFDAWAYGLGIAFIETSGFPELESMNGLFNALNQYIKYLEQNGFAEWSADLEYPIGAGVRVGAVWYRAKTQNTNKPPVTSQNDWELFLNASSLSYSNPIYIENNVVKVRDASTAQKGVVQFANATEVTNKNNVSKAINPANASTIAQSTDLGVGQTWQNVSRSLGATYTNTTGKPIQVCVCISHGEQVVSIMRVSNVIVSRFRQDVDSATGYQDSTHTAIVPNGAAYSVTGGSLISWAELR